MTKPINLVFAGALLLAGSSLYGQGKGDAAKGKAVFDQNCAVCHNSDSTEVKMGPGLKGVSKKPKMNDAAIHAKIDAGGNGMPPYKDVLSDNEKNDVIAFLKTL